MGYCDRSSGLCICDTHQYSSNGTMSQGSIGDCSYFDGNPDRLRDTSILFGSSNPDTTFN